jgi:hypothetical protein
VLAAAGPAAGDCDVDITIIFQELVPTSYSASKVIHATIILSAGRRVTAAVYRRD